LARAPVVGHAVAGDAVQPGRERRVGTPVRPRRHHPLPGVLEDLVGQPGVAQLAQQETVEALAVATVEPFERGHVAAGPGPHQRVVAGLVGGSGRQVLHAREGKPWPRGREARARRRAAVHHWDRSHRGEAPCQFAARGRFPRFHRGTHSGTGGGTARVQAMLDIPVNTAPREIDLAGLAGMLAQSLPTGSGVVVCWDDERLGAGRSEVDGVGESLRARAHALAAGERMSTDDSGALIDESWTEGEARVAIAARLPEPLSPGSREAWRALARRLVSATIAAAQAEARIESLRKSERLQQALYEIADLAGSGLEMEEMLKRIHGVVGGLMSAANFYIVLYDDVRATLRFLYFADRLDPWVAHPEVETPVAEMPNSLTVALLRHGQPLRGPSERIRDQLRVERDPAHGPDAADWLGVPMRREGRVSGAIVVQSYDSPNCYTDEDRALLEFVAQHILTALDRKHAQDELERRVVERTRELQLANEILQAEIVERQRAERLQRALFRISELSFTARSVERFYGDIHAVVVELLYARNFYIARVTGDGGHIEFPYSVDERDIVRKPRRMIRGLSEYVINSGRALLADRAEIARLEATGEMRHHGSLAHCWLGVPLMRDGVAVGVIAVQSYSPEIGFTVQDQKLLTFVAHHIGGALARKR